MSLGTLVINGKIILENSQPSTLFYFSSHQLVDLAEMPFINLMAFWINMFLALFQVYCRFYVTFRDCGAIEKSVGYDEC